MQNRIGVFLVVFLVTLAPLSAQTALFFPARTSAVGANPVVAITADFNRDGVFDTAVSNSGSSTISILLGAGNGYFGPQRNISLARAPQALIAGDFNGDGFPDIAVVNGNFVSVLIGNGDGTFRPPLDTAVSGPTALAAGDFNGDGNLDLAITSGSLNSALIFFGNGDGTFRLYGSFAAGSNPTGLALGDFNSDGRTDLAVVNSGSVFISILIGNFDGSFQAPINVYTGGSLLSIVAADFNNDGNLDLAVLAWSDSLGVIVELLGNGDATFQNAQRFPLGANPVLLPIPIAGAIPRPAAMAVTDVNLDGAQDLVVALAGNNEAGILFGTGTGSFQPIQTFPTGTAPFSVAVAGTGLLLANYQSNSLSLLLNNTVLPVGPAYAQNSIVNAASFVPGPISPGEIISIFGSGFPSNFQILIGGVSAPILSSSDSQVVAVVPQGLTGRTRAQLQNQPPGFGRNITLPVVPATPALFSANAAGWGQGAILNEDRSANSAANPAAQGSLVTLFGTGFGSPVLPVTVSIGRKLATVESVIENDGEITVSVRVPDGLVAGNVPIAVTVFTGAGNIASPPGITIAVQ